MTETHSVKRHLDVDAEAYDVQIRRFIPSYDDMLATAVDLLASLTGPTVRVLDLGGGTGALSSAILDGLPQARVTVLDIDAEMLAEARRRLARFGDRVGFREASFLDPLPTVDAVVASLALHHVHDLDQKTEMYRAICAALTPGGAFLNLDAAVSEDPRVNALVFDRLASHLGEHGIADADARAHFAAWALTRTVTSRWTPSSRPCGAPGSPRSSASGAAGSARSAAVCARPEGLGSSTWIRRRSDGRGWFRTSDLSREPRRSAGLAHRPRGCASVALAMNQRPPES